MDDRDEPLEVEILPADAFPDAPSPAPSTLALFAYEGSRDDVLAEMTLLGTADLDYLETLDDYAERHGLAVGDCGPYVLVGEAPDVGQALALGEAWVRDNLIFPGGGRIPHADDAKDP